MATIHDFARMCNYYEHCEDCPLHFVKNGCDSYLKEHPDDSTRIIDEWIAEHPKKTYASNFFDKFPNAPKDNRGCPIVCLEKVYGDCGCILNETENINYDCCKKCWDREYKGE